MRLSEAQQASFAAFTNRDPLDGMQVIFHDDPVLGMPDRGRDGQAPPDEDAEPLGEAHFEYDHDREEFSGMYS